MQFLQQGPQLLTQETSVGDYAWHEALLRRSTQKDRPGHRGQSVQVYSFSPLRREPLLRQALLEDRPARSGAGAEEGRRKAAQDRPDRAETHRREEEESATQDHSWHYLPWPCRIEKLEQWIEALISCHYGELEAKDLEALRA